MNPIALVADSSPAGILWLVIISLAALALFLLRLAAFVRRTNRRPSAPTQTPVTGHVVAHPRADSKPDNDLED